MMLFIYYLFHRLHLYTYNTLHLFLKKVECVKKFECGKPKYIFYSNAYIYSLKCLFCFLGVICISLYDNLCNELNFFVMG